MTDQEHLNSIGVHQPDEIKSFDDIEKEFSIEDLKGSISYTTRKISLKVGNDTFLFHLVNLSEKKKYGTKSSEKIDENSGLCTNASLSHKENQIFLPGIKFKGKGKLTKKEKEKGMTEKIIDKNIHSGIKKGSIYIDEDGDYVHKKSVEVFDEANKKLDIIPSSLYLKNSPNEIDVDDTIDINEAFDHDIKSRYILFSSEEGDTADLIDLLYDLENSDITKYLAFKFNFFPGYESMDCFLQLIEENDTEYILMNVGNKIETKYYGMETLIGDDLEIEDDFEFDFSL